jgi:hypothetical protein
MEEREYSVLEIVKVNFKNWKILLGAVLLGALVLGGYQFAAAKPTAQYYYETSQMNASFYMKEYNSESITERYLSVKALGQSHMAYERFQEETGYELTYDDFLRLLQFADGQYIEVQQIYFAYPESYGNLNIETEEQAEQVMLELLQTFLDVCDEYIGEGNIEALDTGYTTVITHYEAGTPTSYTAVLKEVVKGAVAGGFFGFVLAFILVSLGYMIGTVTKTAEEIKTGLQAPILGFVRSKKKKEQEIKKIGVFFETKEHRVIHYLPFAEAASNGAKDLADSYVKLGKKVLYFDCASADDSNVIKGYLLGKQTMEEAKAFLKKASEEYDYVIIRSADLKDCADGYRIAGLADENVICCRRRSFSGTELVDVRNTFEVNGLHITGAVVYGN